MSVLISIYFLFLFILYSQIFDFVNRYVVALPVLFTMNVCLAYFVSLSREVRK